MRQTLYRYFSKREYAEEFLDGNLYFNSLGYFCDYEDKNVRRDMYEGTSLYGPDEGLLITNYTRGTSSTIPRSALESGAKLDEIFVMCASQSFTDVLRDRFEAVACVEISKIQPLCTRIRKAIPNCEFYNRPVKYYDSKKPPEERWAIPDLIATSKVEGYSWQDEYRFIFSPTDALVFENVNLQIRMGEKQSSTPTEHPHQRIQTKRNLRDFCKLREVR